MGRKKSKLVAVYTIILLGYNCFDLGIARKILCSDAFSSNTDILERKNPLHLAMYLRQLAGVFLYYYYYYCLLFNFSHGSSLRLINKD
jgi:hypothetical protein